MIENYSLKWLKKYISPDIRKAFIARPNTIYTEPLLAGIAMRETGELIERHGPLSKDELSVCSILRGDYSQRPGETGKQYHGYGITQIDINSFPDFVKSGKWKNPYDCFVMTIDVLEGKRKYISGKFPMLWGPDLIEYVVAAYNCGEGNEAKIISNGLDPDAYTTGHDYAEAVLKFAEIYKTLP